MMGYCPRPKSFDNYQIATTSEQFFIHLPPASVEVCEYRDHRFLNLSHVYGGPVSAAVIEELAFYGIQVILAYGLAGAIDSHLKMGDYYLIESARVGDGTSVHYTKDKEVAANGDLSKLLLSTAAATGFEKINPVKVFTNDAIYRESEALLALAKRDHCDIINCDSSHLFAVSKSVGIKSVQCGVISDANSEETNWSTSLNVMLSDGPQSVDSPIKRLEPLIEFYIKSLLPKLGPL